MNLSEYKTALLNHDWYYYFSDDHRVWSAGEAASNNLIAIARNNDAEFKRVYNEEHEKRFNTESFYPKNGDRKYTPPFQLSS